MTGIKLYKMLQQIPGTTDRDAQDAISKIVFKDDIKHLATKEDIARVETNIANLDAKINTNTANLDAKIETSTAKLKTEIEKRARLTTMWIVGANTVLFSSMIAAMILLLN